MKKINGLHRKGSVARKIQDYFLSGAYKKMIDDNSWWCWFEIPNNTDFCVALEWQGGYDANDKDIYGDFMQGEDAINVSIKFTDEFSINGEYALYAETYYLEDENDDLTGGMSLTKWDIENKFYAVSKSLAEDFNRFNRMKKRREC